MTAPDLLPCPFCEGGITSIEGKGQIWRGVKGYSDPQWYQLNHFGKLSDTDDFPRCNVEFRCRTEAEAIAAWNTRATPAAMTPEVRALVEAAERSRDGLLTTWAESRERHLAAEAALAAERETVARLEAALRLLHDNVVLAFPTLANLGPVANARAALTQKDRTDGRA